MKFKFNKDIYDSPLESCEAGSNIAYEVDEAVDENGVTYLIESPYDLQAVIESYADSCSIERIIQAHGLGDDLLMNQKPGVFIDEDTYNTIQLSQKNSSDINAQILSLYGDYKDRMSFSEFYDAVIKGDFEKLEKPAQKEVTE